MSPNIYTIGACIIASSGALLFGLDVGVTGGVVAMPSFVEKFFPDTYESQQNHLSTNSYCSFDSQLLSLFTSSFFLAGMLSSLPASWITEKCGRKTSMCVGAILYLLGSILNVVAADTPMLIVGRLILGLGCGFANQAVPIFFRTTQAADKQGLSVALRVAFTGGAVMGFTVVGLGLAGLSFFFWLMTLNRSVGVAGSDELAARSVIAAVDSLASFGFGASSIALFARVAGGIYTKAADVGADLVGKVEMDIPEDDPRNPAVIADNVGDNVGDVAGMGADLFESFVGSIIAAATLANGNAVKAALPFWIAGAGIVASLFGFFAVSTKDGANQRQLMFALHKGVIASSVLVLAFSAIIVSQFFPGDQSAEGWKIFACIAIGLIAGILIGQATEYYHEALLFVNTVKSQIMNYLFLTVTFFL